MNERLPLTKTKLGDVHLFIKTENWVDDAEIPSYPVESGLDISDHVEDKANIVALTGTFYTDQKLSYVEKLVKLRKYKNEGRLLNYAGKRSGVNFLINSFSYDSKVEISNGHDFTLVLKEVRIAKKVVTTKKQTAKTKTSSGKQQTQGKKTSVVYHTIKKGDTYIGLGKKYGTDWKQIKKWAGYPDNNIPNGVKVRVK